LKFVAAKIGPPLSSPPGRRSPDREIVSNVELVVSEFRDDTRMRRHSARDSGTLHATIAELVETMGMRIEPGRDLDDTVAAAVARLADDARKTPGAALPTERAIGETLGVTRHAVRKALDRLESEGRIWRHVGRGTFAGPRPTADASDPRSVARHATPREIADARRLLEPQLAAAAAGRASPAQIADLEDALRRCAAARNMESYEVADEAFHRAIAAATGSLLLVSLFESINLARREIAWGAMRNSALKPERRDKFTAEHERIVRAIRDRDAQAAWSAMRAHVETIARIYDEIDKAKSLGKGLIAI
jgi:DNA-binding FadR family transcriptional regulator